MLISPALKLYEILRQLFTVYGFPIPILHALIKGFEEQFGYDLKIDNPDKLLPLIRSDILLVHDKQDKTIAYLDTLEASMKFPNFCLHTTEGLGHKKILFDKATVTFIADHINSRLNSHVSIDRRKANGSKVVPLKKSYKIANFERRLHLFLECPKKGFYRP